MEKTSSGVADENGATDDKAGRTKRLNPWKMCAGIWRDNPDFDAFLKEIERLRAADVAETAPE